jgi:hypothetical protein
MQTINRPSHIASWSRELGAQTAVFRQVKQGLGFSVEKQNQTMRRHRKRFARLTACHSKKMAIWRPSNLAGIIPPGSLRMSPVARVTLWGIGGIVKPIEEMGHRHEAHPDFHPLRADAVRAGFGADRVTATPDL